MSNRLTTLEGLPSTVLRPGYDRDAHGVGIVHIGLGAFHKAHQAVYTDAALGASGGDWRILGVSLRSETPARELKPQDGLYTVIARSAAGSEARVIGALAGALCLATDRDAIEEALTSPATRIVSITVTEKGYGLDRATGGVDPTHPAIAEDLADPDVPVGLAGLLVRSLARRRAAGVPSFTVMSCDNLPDNGPATRGLLVDFARRAAPDIADHIADEVAFPSTMVDRITPARSEDTLTLAAQMTGRTDLAAVETEAFHQWVIEDEFPTGRPDWGAGSAIFASDVRPYEKMKLRMLNGTHSMLAYLGFLAGLRYVRDVMADDRLVVFVRRHLATAAATLDPLPGVDFEDYARKLEARFRNPHIAHETHQIAMDGSEKMPQRIFAPAVDALARGQDPEPFALATAAWIRYLSGRKSTGETYDLRDPREAELRRCWGELAIDRVVDRALTLPGICPDILGSDARWKHSVVSHLSAM